MQQQSCVAPVYVPWDRQFLTEDHCGTCSDPSKTRNSTCVGGNRTWSAETWTQGTLVPAFSPTHVCIKISEGIYNKTHVSCIKRREWYDRTQTEVDRDRRKW